MSPEHTPAIGGLPMTASSDDLTRAARKGSATSSLRRSPQTGGYFTFSGWAHRQLEPSTSLFLSPMSLSSSPVGPDRNGSNSTHPVGPKSWRPGRFRRYWSMLSYLSVFLTMTLSLARIPSKWEPADRQRGDPYGEVLNATSQLPRTTAGCNLPLVPFRYLARWPRVATVSRRCPTPRDQEPNNGQRQQTG